MIYGVTGFKQHGKDTFSEFVRLQNRDYEVLHFADKLREICSEAFDIPVSVMLDPNTKEKPFEKSIYIDDYLPKLEELTNLELPKLGKKADNPRDVLKEVGTGYIRKVKDSYWRDIIYDKLVDEWWDKNVLISDTRFVNEAKVIKEDLEGKIIRILRLDMPPSGDTHPSELETLNIEADLTVATVTGDFTIMKLVAALIAHDNWDLALKYDFRYMMEGFNRLNVVYDNPKFVIDMLMQGKVI